MATESGGAATTGDETVATAGDETATTGGVMYADEGPYTIDVRHIEEMVGTTREAADSDRVLGDEGATRPGTRLAVPGTRPAATAGDERDGGNRWGNVSGRRELEFDEDEMAALEGQRLVAEFRRGIY